jgi:hypothetical protein
VICYSVYQEIDKNKTKKTNKQKTKKKQIRTKNKKKTKQQKQRRTFNQIGKQLPLAEDTFISHSIYKC